MKLLTDGRNRAWQGKHGVYIELTRWKYTIIDADNWAEIRLKRWNTTNTRKSFYANTSNIDGNWHHEYMHRVILKPKNGFVTDHKNGNGLDNRKDNLRYATQSENLCNRKLGWNKRKYKGVSKHKSSWGATIHVNKKLKRIGHFLSLHDALRAYNEAAKKYHGEFARLNVIDENIPDIIFERVIKIKKNGIKNTSKYRGVSFIEENHLKWRAIITHRKTRYKLGNFVTELEGARAYNRKAIELLGKSAILNKF